MGETAHTHTNDAKSKSQSGVTVAAAAVSFSVRTNSYHWWHFHPNMHAAQSVQPIHLSRRLWLLFRVCMCARRLRPNTFGGVKCERDFFLLLHSQLQWNAMLLSFYMKNKHKRKELCEYVIISHIIVISIIVVVVLVAVVAVVVASVVV